MDCNASNPSPHPIPTRPCPPHSLPCSPTVPGNTTAPSATPINRRSFYGTARFADAPYTGPPRRKPPSQRHASTVVTLQPYESAVVDNHQQLSHAASTSASDDRGAPADAPAAATDPCRADGVATSSVSDAANVEAAASRDVVARSPVSVTDAEDIQATVNRDATVGSPVRPLGRPQPRPLCVMDWTPGAANASPNDDTDDTDSDDCVARVLVTTGSPRAPTRDAAVARGDGVGVTDGLVNHVPSGVGDAAGVAVAARTPPRLSGVLGLGSCSTGDSPSQARRRSSGGSDRSSGASPSPTRGRSVMPALFVRPERPHRSASPASHGFPDSLRRSASPPVRGMFFVFVCCIAAQLTLIHQLILR